MIFEKKISKFWQQNKTITIDIPDDLKVGEKLTVVNNGHGEPIFGGFLGVVCTEINHFYKFEREKEQL